MFSCEPLSTQPIVLPPVPSWVPLIGGVPASLYADFTVGNYWYSANNQSFGTVAGWIAALGGTFTRASTGYYTNSSGLLASAGNNVLRFDYSAASVGTPQGILLEGGSTNLALHSRDWTQASWTATNVTTSLNQTGADGSATSATSLTASAGNGTVLQSITQASTNGTFSVFIKRLTGSGEVDITLDGGATWTNVASLINSSVYTAVSHTQTVTNSQFGVRIVTNGDAVAVDFAQSEALGFRSSPIPTTASTATRATDIFNLGSTAYNILNAGPSTVLVEGQGTPFNVADVLVTHPLQFGLNASFTQAFIYDPTSGLFITFNFGSGSGAGSTTLAFANDSSGTSAVANQGTVGTSATPISTTQSAFSIGTLPVGASGQFYWGDINKVAVWPIKATNAQLQALM